MKIVFIGDSITECGRDKADPQSLGDGYVAILREKLKNLYEDVRFEFLNRGVSHDRVADVQARIQKRRRLRRRNIITANSTLNTVVNRINRKFMPSVLRTTRHASEDVKKNSKFFKPAHGLSKIPKSTRNFLKARMIPPMGM